jgi:site-specific DNA-methyltransferase (adenine-specific)
MTRHVDKIGPVTLILGNSIDEMAYLTGKIDLVCTDPPYELTSGGAGTDDDPSMKGMFASSKYSNSGSLFEEMTSWAEFSGPISRTMKKGTQAYVMCNDKNVSRCQEAFTHHGLIFHNLLVWRKNTCIPNRQYMKRTEFCLMFGKQPAFTIGNPSDDNVFDDNVVPPGQKVHKSQKPISLLSKWIENSSKPGDLVLDPFSGSGATAVAAARLGRRAIVIEKDQEYFEASRKWIRENI